MKKILICLAAVALFTACDFLDVIPSGKATIDDLYKTQQQADKYVASMYAYMPNRYYFQSSLEICNGDMMSSYYGSVRYFKWKSLMFNDYESPSNTYVAMWSTSGTYPTGAVKYPLWEGVRNCYSIINNVNRVPDASEEQKDIWRGEAYFMIAYIHQTLLEYYGPIVLVTRESGLNDSSDVLNTPRATYDECIQFISDTYDKAAQLLPETWNGTYYGRATKTAALALKARAWLQAASPMVNGNTWYANFKNQDGTNLISQTYDREKWKKAMDAAQEAIVHGEANGFGLYESSSSVSEPDLFQKGLKNYRAAFVGEQRSASFYNNKEHLFSYNNQGNVSYNTKNMAPRIGYTSYNSAGFRGYFVPTMEAVAMYQSKNGLPMDVDPETKNLDLYSVAEGDSTALLHRNREPRFYASIGYDRGEYEINGGTIVLKCRRGEPQQNDGQAHEYQTCTGYYIQKWVNAADTYEVTSQKFGYNKYSYPYIRMAELYLNYAEAEAEYSGSLSAVGQGYLNKVRRRAGLPDFADAWAKVGGMPTGERLVEVIRQERMCEFMFEGRWYFDIRRWKIAADILTATPKAWNLAGKTAKEFYKLTDVRNDGQTRTFTTKNYWLAIPVDQMNTNPHLVQNPGYAGGCELNGVL